MEDQYSFEEFKGLVVVATYDQPQEKKPAHDPVENLDPVNIKYEDNFSVLYNRFLHPRALLSLTISFSHT